MIKVDVEYHCGYCGIEGVTWMRERYRNETPQHWVETLIEGLTCYHRVLAPMCLSTYVEFNMLIPKGMFTCKELKAIKAS